MQFHLHQNSTYVRHFLDENCVQIDIFRISPLKFRQTLANTRKPKTSLGHKHSQSHKTHESTIWQ